MFQIADHAWTIFPLIEVMMIQLEAEDRLDWICLLNENTELDLRNLNELVQKKSLKPREEALFFGRALQDKEPTIIHHFSQDKLLYPDPEAGMFLSRKLVLDLWRRIKDPHTLAKDSQFPSDFNIDPAYEFAKFVFNEGEGVALENIAQICTQKASGCVTYSRNDYSCIRRSDTAGLQDILSSTLVAVKTCSKFHKDRVKAVKQTWAPLVENLLLVSDKEDEELGTKVLPFTVNTEAGHCNKTLAIIEHFRTQEKFKFLVIVDDDTVLSVVRLAQLLSCYTEDDAFLLGKNIEDIKMLFSDCDCLSVCRSEVWLHVSWWGRVQLHHWRRGHDPQQGGGEPPPGPGPRLRPLRLPRPRDPG